MCTETDIILDTDNYMLLCYLLKLFNNLKNMFITRSHSSTKD